MQTSGTHIRDHGDPVTDGEERRQRRDDGDGDDGDGDDGQIWIFPSWSWLYGAVLIYSTALIILLHIFTITLDVGAP